MASINVVSVSFDGKKEGERLKFFLKMWFRGGIYFGEGEEEYYQEFRILESGISIEEFNYALKEFEEYEYLLSEQFGDIYED